MNRWIVSVKLLIKRCLTDIIKGFVSIADRGIAGTFKKINTRFRRSKAKRCIKREIIKIPPITFNPIVAFQKKISVIIPTKNAGCDFGFLLSKIRQQKGLTGVEIILVDSGSTDDTIAIGNRFGAKIVMIKPHSFNHGRARNIGAEHAFGDYLFFMTQDVMPISDQCLCKMLRIMEQDSAIAGASARQVPRSDADLFACWQLWYYYNRILCLSGDSIFQVNSEEMNQMSSDKKRRVAQIDNVFCCIRKEIFDKYRFNPLPYAEDLDLGLRLLSDGHKLAFLSSVGVIHSHNRSPSYYLKRSYVDIKHLIPLLNEKTIDWEGHGFLTPEIFFSSLYFFYLKMNSMVGTLDSNSLHPPFLHVFNSIKDLLKDDLNSGNARIETSLEELFDHIHPVKEIRGSEHFKHLEILLNQYLNLINSFKDFLSSYDSIESRQEEFVSALFKLFAVTAGSNIGNMELYWSKKDQYPIFPHRLNDLLSGGI